MSTRLNFWAPEHLIRELQARDDSLSEALREATARYFRLLSRARDEIRGRFSEEELTVLARVASTTVWTPETLDGLIWSLEAALDCEVEECERAALLEKLQRLTLTQHAALVDALERFWLAVGTGKPVEVACILEQ